MKFHPLANIFPLLEGAELLALADDIAKNGLINPIATYEESILDGRNRYAACRLANVEPRFVAYTGDDPLGFVISENLQRRHLTESQRAWAAAELANMRQGERTDLPSIEGKLSQEDAAKLLNVGLPSVERAVYVKKHAVPAVRDGVKAGHIKVSAAAAIADDSAAFQARVMAKIEAGARPAAAIRDAKQEEQRAIPPPEGLYDVVVIDPPWPKRKIEREVTPRQIAWEYPVMTLEEIAEMIIPAALDCHLFLWTTENFLKEAFTIINGWGFKYVFTMVWHKPGGYQPFGLPQYNCEFVIYARRGSVHFVDTKDFPCCFAALRGKHSEKPQEFYDTIARVTHGKRIDMFSRQDRPGFDGWGDEHGTMAGRTPRRLVAPLGGVVPTAFAGPPHEDEPAGAHVVDDL